MDSRHFSCCILLLALSCRYGISYRIYILPQQGDFCLGVFSGDACITWSEYSARPTFVDHSTTLIFTQGTYNILNRYYRPFTVSNIKSLTLIGDGALLQFQLLFSNIGDVNMHNLTLANYPRVDVRNVRSFLMENCTLIKTQSSSSTYGYRSVGLYLYRSNTNRIVRSMFVQVPVDARSSSTLLVSKSSFSNYSSDSCITGDPSSSMTIHSSSFVNNYARFAYVVLSQSSLIIVDCLFDRNSASGSGGVVYSYGDVSVTNSNFTKNEAVYLYRRPSTYRSSRGGCAIKGQRNIYIDNCTFSYYTGSSSIIYSERDWYYYNYRLRYQVHVINSKFYHSSRSIYSYNNVTIMNSVFYDTTSYNEGGGSVYSTGSITALNCAFINSTSVGGGGTLYAQQNITVHNSSFLNSATRSSSYSRRRGTPLSKGGTLWSQGDVIVTNSNISNSQADGDGGAIYTTQNVILNNTIIVNTISQSGNGGAVYSLQSVTTTNSKFSNIRVNIGNGGAIYSGNDVLIIRSSISQCSTENGKGGTVYSTAMPLNVILDRRYTNPNIIFSSSTFSHNLATGGGVLYINGHYNHRMEFSDCTFTSNAVTGDGGVAFLRNTSLSISNCVFNNNTAGTNAGVLDVSLTNVSIKQSSLSNNRAGENGGVFYGITYTMNFTIVQTVFEHNAATNGGVFYICPKIQQQYQTC